MGVELLHWYKDFFNMQYLNQKKICSYFILVHSIVSYFVPKVQGKQPVPRLCRNYDAQKC